MLPSSRAAGIAVSVLAFVVLFGYAIARPSIESLFLEAHGSAALPWAWLGVAAGAAVAVAAYGRATARRPLGVVLAATIAASALVLVVLLAAGGGGTTAYLLYVWKDVHVVLLIEALWSFANTIFSERTARWAYGLFCAAGSLGGISGNLAVGRLSTALGGTARALWVELPVFAAELAIAAWLARAAGNPRPRARAAGTIAEAVALFRRERFLLWLLGLVATVQIVVTLVDYLFAGAAVAAYPATDARTAFLGHVYAAVDLGSLVLQVGTAGALRLLGLGGTLLSFPALLGATLLAFAATPAVAVVAAAKWTSKALDYSLFRAAKEILYIPLDYEAKTRGKAIVDILGYRLAKAAASALVLLAAALASWAVLAATLALVALWTGITVGVIRRRRVVVPAAGD
jgi:ATP:ADP antiporter, AAA family